MNFQCVQAIFTDATTFFSCFLRHMIFITSPLSLASLIFTSSLSSPLLFPSLLLLLSVFPLWSFLLCLVLVVFVSLFCVTASAPPALLLLLLPSLLVLLLLLVCCCVAAGRRRCWCCWWVLRVLERLSLVSGRFFCLFSPSFRPLLSSCQMHSARRAACT